MLRVVERTLGEGELSRGGAVCLRAGYELTLYQHWTNVDGALVPGHFEVEGHLLATPDALDALLGVSSPLTLRLDDGRSLDLYVVNVEGAITGADERGFYRT